MQHTCNSRDEFESEYSWLFCEPTPSPFAASTRLTDERQAVQRVSRHCAVDGRRYSRARDVLTYLPAQGESLHLLHVGLFDGVDVLSVALEIAGSPCEHLRVATLGLNERSLAVLCDMLDSGTVRTLTLVCSHYFKSVDRSLFGRIRGELERRGCRVAIARSHAKVWLMHLADGRHYIFEGSGNLRSCKSAEQLTVFQDADLHDFHAEWIDELIVGDE